jgi:hypothetical protein
VRKRTKTKAGIVIIAIFTLLKLFGVYIPDEVPGIIVDMVGLLGALLAAFGVEDKMNRLLDSRGVE